MSRGREQSLEDAIRSLRSELPRDAPVVLLPSLRARDYAEIVHGHVLPLGLASSRLGTDWLGELTCDDEPVISIFRGTLTRAHQPAVITLLDQSAKSGKAAVLVADEFDPQIFSLLMVNHVRGTVRIVALAGRGAEASHAYDELARLSGATVGSARTALVLGTAGTASRLIAGLEHTIIVETEGTLGAKPVGIVYVGGDDLAHARARAR
jgi:chaperonin GroEL